MAHAPAGPFARLPAPVPEEDVLAEARRAFDKQRATDDHCGMMPTWDKLSIPVRQAWLDRARRTLAWREEKIERNIRRLAEVGPSMIRLTRVDGGASAKVLPKEVDRLLASGKWKRAL